LGGDPEGFKKMVAYKWLRCFATGKGRWSREAWEERFIDPVEGKRIRGKEKSWGTSPREKGP